MSAHSHVEKELVNPGSFHASGRLKGVLFLCALVGLAATAGAFFTDTLRAWPSFLINHFYFLCLGLGGLFFAAIQWLTGAMWSAPVRRVSESFTAYLPVAVLTTVVIFIGMHDLFHWTHPEVVKGDIVLEGKAPYLNEAFFIVRNCVFLLAWLFFSHKMIGNSLAQDQDPGNYRFNLKNRVLAPIFLVVFGFGFTFTSFDQLMSLDPHWFSTMFGVYAFAGLFYSNLAITCLLTIYLRRKGHLKEFVNENHLHDLGKFMFAFTVFWAYIGFSQFMLIWYANLPEETGYFLRRMDDAWMGFSLVLFFGKFILPFFWLLPRAAKRSESRLMIAGIFMLIAQWVDLAWLVQPEFFKDGPHIGWIEIGMFVGFAGVFGLTVLRFLSKNNVVAIGDPRLQESVFHHHQ
ncbi:MAG: hypothetical protein CL678_04740 [Bdellovibrionaceae bacterium]|nr:hypothetical protein [Pseudobdellovibrionaceae bacterium]